MNVLMSSSEREGLPTTKKMTVTASHAFIPKLYSEYSLCNVSESSESPGFSLALHKFEHIAHSHWSLHVADEVSLIGFLSGDEDDLDLRDASTRTGPAQQLRHSCLNGL